MVYTVPDVRKPGVEKYYPLTFILSIVWIGLFSYLMVSGSLIQPNFMPHAVLRFVASTE